MSLSSKILAFAGSARRGSFNQLLLNFAAEGARAAGAEVTVIDWHDFQMPLYDADLEAQSGLPEPVRRLKALFLAHGGLLIASPEYNSSVTALLKNALDWVSRPAPGEASLACFDGKVAALLSASPGALGGLRGLVHLRAILGNIKVIVLPEQVAVPRAHEAFDADGKLKDARIAESVVRVGERLAWALGKLGAS